MAWYFQETPGDTWDFTSTQPIILADLKIDGKTRKVLMSAPKNGFFYMLDRITGEFISGDKYAQRVTWATGLDKNGHPIEAKGARFTTEPIPSPRSRWSAQLAADVVQSSDRPRLHSDPGAPWTYVPDPNFKFAPGYWNTGMEMGRRPPGPDGEHPPPILRVGVLPRKSLTERKISRR